MISKLFYFLIFLLLFTGLAQAGAESAVFPLGSSDQNEINNALISVYHSGGRTVYLSAGIYNIDGQIKIGSNTVLTGDSNAIIRVSSSSSQFFTGTTGIISSLDDSPHNVEIHGFQIDGNCENLPTSYNSNDQDPHDCERLILFQCDSGNYGNNISINDMKLYDAYSDGIHIAFAHKVFGSGAKNLAILQN